MSNQYPAVSASERNAVVSVCLLAALADGALSEAERGEIQRMAEGFSDAEHDFTQAYGQALAGKTDLAALAKELSSENARTLAYEMAVGICHVDQALGEGEPKFLADLRSVLNLDPSAGAEFQRNASQLRAEPPVITSASGAASSGLDEMIRDRAILAGALELMPQRLATMAIVPVQMRMVYQIGKSFGYELDLGHTKEFFATVGVGLTSQVVEGYLSKLVGNVTRRFVGRFAGALLSQAAESAIAFATTYALGQVAKSYYQSGRTLTTGQLRDLFSAMLNDGRSMQARYASQIAQRAGSLKIADFMPSARSAA